MKTVDLFCGIGGLSLGFEKAGFDIVEAYDSWIDATEVYDANFSHKSTVLDLSDVENVKKELSNKYFDCIIGGPPCQDFSSAGKRTEKERAKLTICFSEIVSHFKPKLFIMENVSRAKLSESFNCAKQILKSAGYGLTEIVIDASYCKVPQKRKRIFLIGDRTHPDNYYYDSLLQNQDKNAMTVEEYLQSINIDLETNYYYRHPRNYARKAIFSIKEPSPTIRGVNRPIPPNYKKNNLDACDTSDARPLTTFERSLLQTFPKEWKWVGSKTNLEQMVGNAVPVNLAYYVASKVLENHGA